MNDHTTEFLSNPLQVCSFSIARNGSSLSVSREITEIECTIIANNMSLRRITIGNHETWTVDRASKLLSNTTYAKARFGRNYKRRKLRYYIFRRDPITGRGSSFTDALK